jgi:hypothetical protein
MFSRSIVWRGLIFTLLMVLGKMVCGLWLVRIPFKSSTLVRLRVLAKKLPRLHIPHFWGVSGKKGNNTELSVVPQDSGSIDDPQTKAEASSDPVDGTTAPKALLNPGDHTSPDPRKPLSLYPASILSCAMVARGEIGFLISAIAESNGIFSSHSDKTAGASEIFLIVTWAIVLCTILGPVCVGLLVKRVKKLQKGAQNGHNQRTDILGVWGV